MVKTKRWPSRLTFLHCCGFPNKKGPGNWTGTLKRSLGVPALNVGVVVTSTAITSQSDRGSKAFCCGTRASQWILNLEDLLK